MRHLKIRITRDQIQFEGLEFPDDGNSYTRQAASAWECAAIEFIERAGYQAGVDADYGKDHTKLRVYVESTEADDDGNDVEVTDEQEAAAIAVDNSADEAGWEAARKFAKEQAIHSDPD